MEDDKTHKQDEAKIHTYVEKKQPLNMIINLVLAL